MRSIDRASAAFRCIRALAWCLSAGLALPAGGATVAEKAKESGCVNKPVVVAGSNTYKCYTASGNQSYFNIDSAEPRNGEPQSRRVPSNANTSTAPSSPSGFPRVDTATQRSREDMRRKVLGDELATEERLLGEARTAYGNGSPAPLPEEQNDAAKYQQRIARLRQAVQLHERNVEALRKELGR
jgi:hypothetical protein